MVRTAGLFLLAFWSPPAAAQVLLSDSLMLTYTTQELVDWGVGNATNGVEIHRLRYATVDPFGAPTIASGALVLPLSDCVFPLAAYSHGTILDREDVPSRLSSEIVVGYFLGGTGYVTVLPDYLGLGDGPGPHPYMHARSEATATVDMLRAAREFCATRNVDLSGQLFLIGYSQGGHACMATHRMIQEELSEEFSVTASAPCSGPYDVSGVQAQAMVDTVPYPAPYYLPYVLFSYGHVYPGLYGDISEVIEEPWATLLPPLFQGNNGSGAVDAVMPQVPSVILVDSVLEAFSSDPDHYFRVALRDNDVYDWAPQAPVRMVYCESDSHVFHENSLVCRDSMLANGAVNVQAVSAGASFDHGDCAFPALLGSKNWFDTMRWPCSLSSVDEVEQVQWSVHPNPAQDRIMISSSREMDGRTGWRLLLADGRLMGSGDVVMQHGTASLELPAGLHGPCLLLVQDAQTTTVLRLVVE
jgi:pimeloyl-ACP methyl ester carboxylesterase